MIMIHLNLNGANLKVEILRDHCTGHGRCFDLAPEVFGENELGEGFVKVEDIPANLRDLALEGVVNCPEQAIRIIED